MVEGRRYYWVMVEAIRMDLREIGMDETNWIQMA
jgi:hypothetical protein